MIADIPPEGILKASTGEQGIAGVRDIFHGILIGIGFVPGNRLIKADPCFKAFEGDIIQGNRAEPVALALPIFAGPPESSAGPDINGTGLEFGKNRIGIDTFFGVEELGLRACAG